MYEQSISVMVNATSSMIKHAIDVLDADVSELDPNVVALSAVCVPLLVLFASVFVSWFQKCGCCCFCCFGRRLVPNTDVKEEIIGDDEFDAEAVHIDPTIPSDSDALNPKKHVKRIDSDGADGADDGIAPTSPPATESSEDDMEEEDEEDELKPENRV